MNRRLPLAASLALLSALAACNPQVSGNGELGEETRTVAPFDAVDISLGAEATVNANATSQRLSISVDENLLQYILTPVEDGVLRIRLNGVNGIDSVHPLRLVAQAKALHAVRATEAAYVDVKGAGQPGLAFEVEAAGLSNVQLQGPGGDLLQVRLSGGSGLDAFAYPVAGAEVALSGGSSLRVNSQSDPVGTATDRSHVAITGGGTCAALVRSADSDCIVQ
jgi:Putative auto-transporter adhesin, head GIN domain